MEAYERKIATAAGGGRLGNDFILLPFSRWVIYCTKAKGPTTEIQQFLVNDVTFLKLRRTCGFLSSPPLNASKKELLSEVVATLRIIENKNFFKGACVHHGVLEG